MTVGQQSQQKTIHQILLSDHNVTDLLSDRWNPLPELSYFLRNFLRRFRTVCSDSLRTENVRSNRDQRPPAYLLLLASVRTGRRRGSLLSAGTQRQNDWQPGIGFSFADAGFEVTVKCFRNQLRIIYE